MLYNKNESPATTINGQTPSIPTALNDTDKVRCNYSEKIASIKISEASGNFLVCMLLLSDLYSKLSDALRVLYNDNKVDKILQEDFDKLNNAMQDIFLDYFTKSVSYNIALIDFTEI